MPPPSRSLAGLGRDFAFTNLRLALARVSTAAAMRQSLIGQFGQLSLLWDHLRRCVVVRASRL